MNFRQKLYGNAAIYLGSNILNAGIPFLLLPILTRVLTPADYGTVAMFAIVLSVLGAFTGLSVHGAIGVRYFTMEKQELASYVGTCVGILVVSTSILLVLVALGGSWFAKLSGVPIDWLLVAVVVSGLQFLGNIRLSLWQVAGQAKQYGAFQISQSLLNAGLSLTFILLLGLAWQGRVIGQVASIGIFGLVAVWRLLKDELLKKPVGWRVQVADALHFGVPLIPHVLGALVLATAGQFFVTNLLGVAGTGIYVVAAQVGAVVGLIADAFVKSYSPWLYAELKDESANSKHGIVCVTYMIFAFFLVLSALVSAVVFIVFPFIIGEKFLAARSLAIFFIFGNGFTGMYMAIAGFFFFTSKTKYISIVSLSAGCVSLLGMWAFGNAFGLKGIAFGFLFSQVVMFVLAWMMSTMVYPMPWLQFRLAYAAVPSLSKRPG